MRLLAYFLALSFAMPAAFAADYHCKGRGVVVDLLNHETTLEITTSAGKKTYEVHELTSRSGSQDESYVSHDGVTLTIDEQYGDRLEISGKSTPVSCSIIR